jgi:hypothetical protein
VTRAVRPVLHKCGVVTHKQIVTIIQFVQHVRAQDMYELRQHAHNDFGEAMACKIARHGVQTVCAGSRRGLFLRVWCPYCMEFLIVGAHGLVFSMACTVITLESSLELFLGY